MLTNPSFCFRVGKIASHAWLVRSFSPQVSHCDQPCFAALSATSSIGRLRVFGSVSYYQNGKLFQGDNDLRVSSHASRLQSSLFFSSNVGDYAERAANFGISPKEEVKDLAENLEVFFVDVRSAPELLLAKLTARPFIHVPCTPTDASKLTQKAPDIFPDKDAQIVVFCGTGKRASVAKAALESLGYKNVYNGGGLKDLDHL